MNLFVRNIIIICTLLFSLKVKSQDVIILSNGTDTIKCKIIEKNDIYLKFRYNNLDTNSYKINKNKYDRFILKETESINKDSLNFQRKSNIIKTLKPKRPSVNIGIGGGIDYGGIGTRYSIVFIPNCDLFLGLGYDLIKIGENIGLTLRALPYKQICPCFRVMYGYNAAYVVKSIKKYSKVYYGPSISIAIEIRSKKMKNFLNVEMICPFRSDRDVQDAYNTMYKTHYILKSTPEDQLFAVGYHFVIK
jgi:hypothetical protein